MASPGTIDWVCQHWAKQTRGSATARHGQIYFDGPRLYSWGPHYELGRLVELDGKRVALINTDPANKGGSVSTGNHRRCADYAAESAGLETIWVTKLPLDLDHEVRSIHETIIEESLAAIRARQHSYYHVNRVSYLQERVATLVARGATVPPLRLDGKDWAKLRQKAMTSLIKTGSTHLTELVRMLEPLRKEARDA